ncbi:9631_t:CDS:2 [Funneliformis mosseae]|uniref:9631_t:CDS:1 n=1 Tax=Funneliformis mosseae TaxID=27381 RepID=A0A9N9E285_FUNMO|nr:9631_t:CDS:2 [Funneliformis mosseae]
MLIFQDIYDPNLIELKLLHNIIEINRGERHGIITSKTQDVSLAKKILQSDSEHIKELVKTFVPFTPRPASLRLTYGKKPTINELFPMNTQPKNGMKTTKAQINWNGTKFGENMGGNEIREFDVYAENF